MRPDNSKLISQRWPLLAKRLLAVPLPQVEVLHGEHFDTLRVQGIQLESACDPKAEAELQARLVPAGSSEALVYGLAQASLIRELLGRPEICKLQIVLLSERAAHTSLTFFDHSDWLGDARVELRLPVEGEELKIPLAVATAALTLADGHGTRLRDLIEMELARPHVQNGQCKFDAHLARNLEGNHAALAGDPGVSTLFGTYAGQDFAVAAAGPTLADHFEALRGFEGPLIAVDAALKALLTAGIRPDFVVSLDSVDYTMRAFFDVEHGDLKDSKLIYFPNSFSGVVKDWQGARYSARQELGHASGLYTSGSVIHPSVDLAVQLGARSIQFFGADFATPRGRSHVGGTAFSTSVALDTLKPTVLDGRGNQVQSLSNLVGYLRDLERYIKKHPEVSFWNTGLEGARILGAEYQGARHAA